MVRGGGRRESDLKSMWGPTQLGWRDSEALEDGRPAELRLVSCYGRNKLTWDSQRHSGKPRPRDGTRARTGPFRTFGFCDGRRRRRGNEAVGLVHILYGITKSHGGQIGVKSVQLDARSVNSEMNSLSSSFESISSAENDGGHF